MEPTREDVQELVVALFTVAAGMERARRRIRTANALAVLQIVASGRVRPSDIAIALGVHQSSITRQVRALEQAGQVRLAADPGDGRAYFVNLTDAGRDELGRLTELGLDRFAAFVADWDAEEVRTLARLLTRLEHSKAALTQPERPTGGPQRRGPTDHRGDAASGVTGSVPAET